MNSPWNQKGSAAAEFILVAGVLVTLLFGMIELALISDARVNLLQAARAGARRAAIDGGRSEAALAMIREQLDLGRLDSDRARIEIRPKVAAYGSTVRVTVEYDYSPFSSTLRGLGIHTVPLRATLLNRSEYLADTGLP